MKTVTPEAKLKALKGSSKKWKRIVASNTRIDLGRENCPLCVLHGYGCKGCPVRKRTKKTGCRGTPYAEWIKHHREEHNNHSDLSRIPRCKECLRLAKAERDFLISLEPEDSQ